MFVEDWVSTGESVVQSGRTQTRVGDVSLLDGQVVRTGEHLEPSHRKRLNSLGMKYLTCVVHCCCSYILPTREYVRRDTA